MTGHLQFGKLSVGLGFVVPKDYDHDRYIDAYFDRASRWGRPPERYITSKKYARTSHKLTPGMNCTAYLLPVLESVSSQDCLRTLLARGAILVGAQGLILVYEQQEAFRKKKLKEAAESTLEIFPEGKVIVSLETIDHLPILGSGFHALPCVSCPMGEDWDFGITTFERGLEKNVCVLMCFVSP